MKKSVFVKNHLQIDFCPSAHEEFGDALVALLNCQMKQTVAMLIRCVHGNIFIKSFFELMTILNQYKTAFK